MSADRPVGLLTTLGAPLLPLTLRRLLDAGCGPLAVIADAKELGERDRTFWQQRTEGAFDALGIGLHDFAAEPVSFHLVRSHLDEAMLVLLDRLRPPFLVNAGTPRKLTPPILAACPQGVLNVHPGILPRYRGANCVEWAIHHDEPVGNSAHFMTEGYDEGPIIAAETTPLPDPGRYAAIRTAVYAHGIDLMARTVRQLRATGLGPADLPPQGEGSRFRAMTPDLLAATIAKANAGRYRPQQARRRDAIGAQ